MYLNDEIVAHGASLEGSLGLFARGNGVYISMARLNQLAGLNVSNGQTSRNTLIKKIIKKKADVSNASQLVSEKLSRFQASKLPNRMPYGDFSGQLIDVLRDWFETAIPCVRQHGFLTRMMATAASKVACWSANGLSTFGKLDYDGSLA